MNPFSAVEILKMAVEAGLQTVAGKLTEGAIAKGQQLWQAIRQRLQGEPAIAPQLQAAEQNPSEETLQSIAPFLQVEMVKDPAFAQQIQQIAQQVNQELNLDRRQETNVQNISGQGKGYQNINIKGDATFS